MEQLKSYWEPKDMPMQSCVEFYKALVHELGIPLCEAQIMMIGGAHRSMELKPFK
jgi:hypothetical protein